MRVGKSWKDSIINHYKQALHIPFKDGWLHLVVYKKLSTGKILAQRCLGIKYNLSFEMFIYWSTELNIEVSSKGLIGERPLKNPSIITRRNSPISSIVIFLSRLTQESFH